MDNRQNGAERRGHTHSQPGPARQEVVSHGTRTAPGWVTHSWALGWEQEKPGLALTLPDPESPAHPVLQTLMNAPSRISVSLGPARTCPGCSAVPVMMAMNWTGVEATAQVQGFHRAAGWGSLLGDLLAPAMAGSGPNSLKPTKRPRVTRCVCPWHSLMLWTFSGQEGKLGVVLLLSSDSGRGGVR